MNALKKGVVLEKKNKSVVVDDKIILSVVIPCYNSSKTIGRLLDSLVAQVNPPRFEVIIQDDYSTDNFMDIVETYKSKLDIKYFKNKKRKVHCPGNTRIDGMKHVSGEWITFIDHDDMFEINAFNEFYTCVLHNNEKNIVISNFRDYYIDKDTYGKIYGKDSITWLHGKFYNKKFLEDRNINFKEDMYSNEDLYFNQTVFAYIASEELDYSILNVYTYKWIYNDDSLSRSMFKEDEYYIDKYFDEYIVAASEGWFNRKDDNPEIYQKVFVRMCYTMLYIYFYYQSFYLRRGFEHDRRNRDLAEDFLIKIKKTFNVDNKKIIDVVYSDDNLYNKIRQDSIGGCLHLIESESFRDFVNNF